MKKIQIQKKDRLTRRIGELEISVGNKKLTCLKDKSKTLTINELEGAKLKFKSRCFGSKEIPLADIETGDFLCVSSNKRLIYLLSAASLIFPVTGLWVASFGGKFAKTAGICFVAILLIFVIFSLTIWKNSFLKIEKQKR